MRSIAVIVLALTAVAVVDFSVATTHGCTSSTSFDYLELVLQWPVTSCKSSSCNATDAYFTLHGACCVVPCCRCASGGIWWRRLCPASLRLCSACLYVVACRGGGVALAGVLWV